MTTSGTVGLTTVDATSVLEHAVRRCGVLTTAITAEMQISARENLFMILANFAYKGMALWCVRKYVYALGLGQTQVTLDVGFEEILAPLLRSFTANPGVLVAGGATLTFTTPTLVPGAILDVPASAVALTFVLEGLNGAFWVTYGTASVLPGVRSTVCIDNEPNATLLAWRIRETTTGTVALNAATFLTGVHEVTMHKLSLDSYTSLPDKTTVGRPLQFWYDKAFPQQKIWVWPTAPADLTYQLVVWGKRALQDVGDLSNTLELPQRWLDPVIFELSTRVCLELPKELVPAGRYDQLSTRAEDSLNSVLNAEVDGASIRLAPNISGYTR